MYSPTQTKDWLKCPSYWYFKRHYKPIESWKPYKAMGSALHSGLELIMTEREDIAYEIASSLLTNEYEENDEWPLDSLLELLARTLKNLTKSDIIKTIQEHETIIATEMLLESSGSNSFVDLVTKRDGKYIVTDYKTRWELNSKYISKTLIESATDWQLYHYANGIFNKYGEVPIIRLILIILNPKTQVLSHETQLTEDKLMNWLIGAYATWSDIDDYKSQDYRFMELPMNLLQCYDRYGRCEAYDLCHTMEKDESKALTFYKLVDKKMK